MASTSNDSSILYQDTNRFLVYAEIKSQISYSIIRDFINWAN